MKYVIYDGIPVPFHIIYACQITVRLRVKKWSIAVDDMFMRMKVDTKRSVPAFWAI
jgi:hypothetical protein